MCACVDVVVKVTVELWHALTIYTFHHVFLSHLHQTRYGFQIQVFAVRFPNCRTYV